MTDHRTPGLPADNHLAEIGYILAEALMRLTSPKSSQTLLHGTDKPVDCEGVSISHVADLDKENGE